MDNNKEFHFKVYLLQEDTEEYEIRRFSVEFPVVNTYNFLVEKIRSIFPGLSDKVFTLYWKDEEEDEVTVSSDHELYFLIKMPCQVKKLFVKVQPPLMEPKQGESEPVHLGIYCDGCDQNISGIRYKCGMCNDYDLCSFCHESGLHQHHPMYRIPHPSYAGQFFDFGVFQGKHKSRRHWDSGKKKRKFEKRESGLETGEESEEMHHGKYHKKCKKAYKCTFKRGETACGKAENGDDTNQFCGAGPYSQMVNEFLGYFNPVHFQPRQPESQNPANDTNGTEIPSHFSYLKNLGMSLQKVLDPLGVSVEFEVRPKENAKEEKKNEKREEKQASESGPSASPQKEVRFGVNEQLPETMMQKIEEITKILSNQTMNGGTDNDNSWVSYEELKKDTEEPKPSSSAEVPKSSQAQASAPEEEKEKQVPGSQNLYPDLTPRVPSNPAVRTALENMLAMGFSNEGNWLTSLLEAKNGDINQALEALSFQKKVNK